MKQPVYYLQNDPRWGKLPYTIDGDANETISYSGCGPTCAAMILAEWVDPKITPVETCKMAIEMKDRTANDGTEWEFFSHVARKYGLDFSQTSVVQDAVTALKKGALVVCSMGPGYFTRSGHFILSWGVDSENHILVNDPISKVRTKASIDIFKNQCKQYFIFQKSVKVKEEVKMFKDFDKVSPWAKDAVKKVEELGIMNGDDKGNFNPQSPVTREQLAVAITNLLSVKK